MTRAPRLVIPLLAAGAVWALSAVPRAAQAPAAHRIISLVPAVTEMIFAMGGGSDVVGVSSYDRYPPDALARPKVGALVDPDFERILSLRPDLVVVYGSLTELEARLRRLNVPLFEYTHAGLRDITDTMQRLGDRIGRPAEGRRLATRVKTDLEAVRRLVAGRSRPRTALVIGRDAGSLRGVYVSGGVGFLHDILELAGGKDAFADVARQSLPVSTEEILARAPEVILEIYPSGGWPADRIARERALWRALPSLPAVKAHRISLLADDRLVIPGPRVAEGATLIAHALHPDLR
jgi:iron complex transport system substrate-binding protein